jgi:murein lipoprotein
MNRFLIAAATLALLAGCATTEAPQAAATSETASAKPALTEAASAALDSARAAAKDAQAKGALWTTADAALKAAEAAATKGDSETVLKQAKRVNEDVKRGLAQLDYPLVTVD